MPISHLSLVERIARVLAARAISSNAEGEDASAGPSVDQEWYRYADDALAILRTAREPDRTMAAAGDPEIWERMVEAALKAENATAGRRPEAEMQT
jgi:hypothetical protein